MIYGDLNLTAKTLNLKLQMKKFLLQELLKVSKRGSYLVCKKTKFDFGRRNEKELKKLVNKLPVKINILFYV